MKERLFNQTNNAMTKPLAITLAILVMWTQTLKAQAYLMNGSPITDCSGTFYDSGGAAGHYGANEHFVTTICSDATSGTHIQLNFSGIELGPGASLCFYDGPTTGATKLSCASDYPPGQPFIVQATAENPSGCLTVQFDSGNGPTAAGWAAVIKCVASCQQVLSKLVSTNPTALPVDTGWIDVCPGKRIFFNGAGQYPQNGFAYPQSDLTTTFEWNFGDGGIAYGPSANHRYDKPGGYFVQLVLTDAQGCTSTNLISQRVRVAPRPDFNIAGGLDHTICSGDTIHLNAAVDSAAGKTIFVVPESGAFAAASTRSDSLALPDGTGIPYKTSIYFTQFSPGQVLTDPNDLVSICVNMEHSWMRDLQISLTCPNGQNIILHNFAGQVGSRVYLGIPMIGDGFNPIPGTGWDYCWTPNATNPTWIQYANTVLSGNGTLPAGNYSSYQPIGNLIGCPLNGEWTITATDLWPVDNGFIFSWGIKFKDALYPKIEKFTPAFTSWNWNNHPSIFYASPDSIAAAPMNAGTAGYQFNVHDAFGCDWDTLVSLSVLPFTNPACYKCKPKFTALRDTAICSGSMVALNGASLSPASQIVRFEAFPDYRFGNANHPPANPYASPITVGSLGYSMLSNVIAQLAEVCVDIETDFDADLNIYLKSPDGKQLELSTGNGGAGDNYKITCFKPGAAQPITSGSAPFNGNYAPEGAWASLANAQVDGDWKLMVSDAFGPTQFGKVKWWSVGFVYTDQVSYTWSNPASLSCNTCPNPVATPAASTDYVLYATNSFNCPWYDTAHVTVYNFFPAPSSVQVAGISGNTMNFNWSPVPGATGYEVSINGGPWVAANGTTSHAVSGLMVGDQVQLQVRALGSSPNCPPAVGQASGKFVSCTLTATLLSTQPAHCAGGATGSAVISSANGTAPVLFFPDGMGAGLPNGNLNNMFTAGPHFVIVKDALGCADTVNFTITEPAAISLQATATAALCNGDNSGTAMATATGGTAPINFTWQGCSGGATTTGPKANNLLAGCYNVTATDANGCTSTASVTVTEPPAFHFTSMQDPVSCFGGTDGSATINVTGGTPPYTYLWNTGANTKTANNLNASFHTVIITDSLTCQAVTLVQVLQPAQLISDSIPTKPVSCFGGNNGTAAVYVKGGTKSYSYKWSDPAGQTTQKALNLTAGAYTVTVTDAKGCTITVNCTVTTPLQISVSATSVSGEICVGDCKGKATIQASGGTGILNYTWSNPAVPAGTQMSSTLCAGNYTVTVTDVKGCSQQTNFTINPATPITLQLTGTAPSCAGLLDGNIQSTTTGGVLPFQYNWSNGVITGPGLQNIPCGSYKLTLTDAAGCTKTDTVKLNCPAAILISNITPVNIPCFGQLNGQISVSASGGTGALTYQWNDPAAQSTPTATGLAAGSFTVTVTDTKGCTMTATSAVTQPSQLTLTFTKTDVTCFGGQNGSVTSVTGGGTSPYTWLWNNSQTGSSINALAAGTYSVTVTDHAGCTLTGTGPTLTQPQTAVQATATQTQKACFGQATGTATATASGGNGGPYNFAWSNQQTGALISGLSVGTFTVTASDALGCTAVQSVVVTQWDSISVNAAFAPPSCFGLSDGFAALNLISGGAGGGDTLKYTYKWSIPNAPHNTSIHNLAGGQNYMVTVTDLQGCSGSFSFFIPEPQQIALQTGMKDDACFGDSTGTASVVNVQNAAAPLSYAWSNGGAIANIVKLPVGSYTVTVTDKNGCTASATVAVQQPTALQVHFTVAQLSCINDHDGSIATTIQGGTPDYLIHWSNGAVKANLDSLAPGGYTITITDKNGCTLVDSTKITRPDTIGLQVRGTEPSCFGGQNGRLNTLVVGGQPPFQYSLDGKTFGGSANFIGLKAGVYTVWVKGGNGCIAKLVDTLGQPAPVSAALGQDTTIQLGQTLLLSPDLSNTIGLVKYSWKSALVDSIPCVDSIACSEVLVKPFNSNVYTVMVTDSHGCRGSASIRVTVDKPRGVYVPTGFTPNGDLNNDLLQVFGKSAQVKEVRVFRIYDRWGELLYEDTHFSVNDPTRGWDGRFRGKDCEPGVYVWHIEAEYLDGYLEELSGNSMLIR
jgi:gliding motility-associated-like protein